MNLVNSILNWWNKPTEERQNSIPENVCPNCWGRQEYGGKVKELIAEHQIDVNNKVAKHAFIKDFVVQHIEGIQLKKHQEKWNCPTCVG